MPAFCNLFDCVLDDSGVSRREILQAQNLQLVELWELLQQVSVSHSKIQRLQPPPCVSLLLSCQHRER